MRLGRTTVKLQKRVYLSGWRAASISILAILVALGLFSVIFLLAGINPLTAYEEIFSYSFFNPYGLPITLNRFVFLLLCTCAFILPFKAGLWNIGMSGQFYIGSLAVYGVLLGLGFRSSQPMNIGTGWVIFFMVVASMVSGALIGAIAGFFKGRLNTNEIVVTMMLNFIAFWLVSFMIKEGGPFMNPGGRGESFEMPGSLHPPIFFNVPFTIFLALGFALLLYFLLARTKLGYQIRAFGLNPTAAEYAGISRVSIPVLVFLLGGALAGLAGYHYFAAVPDRPQLWFLWRSCILWHHLRVDITGQSTCLDSGCLPLWWIIDGGSLCTGQAGNELWCGFCAPGRAHDHAGCISVLLSVSGCFQ